MQVRRRNPCLIYLGDVALPNLSALLSGSVRIEKSVGIFLLCPVRGVRIELSVQELGLLQTLAGDSWSDAGTLASQSGLSSAAITSMVERGLLIGDHEQGSALRDAEQKLDATGWHPLAAAYHAMTRWSAVCGDEGSRDHSASAHRARIEQLCLQRGLPPAEFAIRSDALRRDSLPQEAFKDGLAEVLRARRTTRHFDQVAQLSAADLGRVLYGTFAAIGLSELAPGVVALRKTSPSGGALHPIDAYPLLIRVEGFESGFYHYEAAHHRLALLRPMSETDARALACSLTIGQSYFGEAHALVFHVARLARNYWKYRRHPKAYKAVLMDAGHLSQTFYLLAAERGLGAFFTAAINDADVGECLLLDPAEAIAVAASGLGIRDDSRHALHLNAVDYDPCAALAVD